MLEIVRDVMEGMTWRDWAVGALGAFALVGLPAISAMIYQAYFM